MRVTSEMREAAKAYTVDGIEWCGRCPNCGDLMMNLPLHVRMVEFNGAKCESAR